MDYGLRRAIMRLRVAQRRVVVPQAPVSVQVKQDEWLRQLVETGGFVASRGRPDSLRLLGASPAIRRGRPRLDPLSTSIIGVSNPVLLVYSHRPEVRERIMTAIGRRPAPDVGRVDYLECEAVHEVMMATQAQLADVLILDGEAQPTGGIGISRQIHQEAAVVPPVVIVVRRADDRWLATWAGADEILVHPLDPVTAAEAIASVLRRRASGLVPAVTDQRPR